MCRKDQVSLDTGRFEFNFFSPHLLPICNGFELLYQCALGVGSYQPGALKKPEKYCNFVNIFIFCIYALMSRPFFGNVQ